MKVGIIVHSYTGNTLGVAQKLREKLLASGHTVNLEQVGAVNEKPSAAGRIQLRTIPDVSDYEVIIFGCPVRGFSLSPVMKTYLSQLPSLKGKKIGCFVTQHFPFPWLGGNRAIRQISRACEDKGEGVLDTGVINWTHKERERKIEYTIQSLSRLL